MCIEPIMAPPAAPRPAREDLPQYDAPLVQRTMRRRKEWASRSEWEEYAGSRPLFASFDQRVQEELVKHMIREKSGDGTVTLKCDPKVEAEHYASDISGIVGFAAQA